MSEEEIRKDVYLHIREIIFDQIGMGTILDGHDCLTYEEYASKYQFKDLSLSNEVTINRSLKPLYGNVDGSKFAYTMVVNNLWVFCLYYFSQEKELLFHDDFRCKKADDGSVVFSRCEGAFWPLSGIDTISKPYSTKEEAFEDGVKAHKKHYENIKNTYQYMLDNITEVVDEVMSCNQLEDRYPNLCRQDFIRNYAIPKLKEEMKEELEGFDFL